MRTIGLIGGMSWESSLEYYRLLNQGVKARLGGLHSARCAMVSVEFAEVEAMMRSGRWADVGALLHEAARAVEAAGADFLLLCTNTMHKVADAMMEGVRIPLLHVVDATGERAHAVGLEKVALLGTQVTMEEDFYRGRLSASHGLDVLVPGPQERALVNRIIFDELCLGIVSPTSRARLVAIAQELVREGAQGVIAGCTEIGLLVKQEDVPVPFLDSTRIHVEAALERALAP